MLEVWNFQVSNSKYTQMTTLLRSHTSRPAQHNNRSGVRGCVPPRDVEKFINSIIRENRDVYTVYFIHNSVWQVLSFQKLGVVCVKKLRLTDYTIDVMYITWLKQFEVSWLVRTSRDWEAVPFWSKIYYCISLDIRTTSFVN